MKRILLPAGGAVLATGLLAAGLVGTASANANPDWATDTMAKDAPTAAATADFWLEANGTANNFAKATSYTTETIPASKLNTSGGYTPDGKPGVVAPIGEEKKSTSVVKNVNLPKSIGKVFFVDSKGKPRWCSATSIQSKYRNLVSTAGHCVYDDKANAQVMDKWVFVPGYYQGKTPWGIYVGKTAYVHYDFNVYNDRDRDYAFVTVYNGIQVGAGTSKTVSKADFDKFTGKKETVKKTIEEPEYTAGVEKYGELGPYKSALADPTTETVAKPANVHGGNIGNYATGDGVGGVKVIGVEVVKSAYLAAPGGYDNNSKSPVLSNNLHPTNISLEEYTALQADKAAGKFLGELLEVKNNGVVTGWTKQQFFIRKWVKSTVKTNYWLETYVIHDGFIKDVGRLGDNVGGQGFTWNQKAGQTVYVFGYPEAAHPDGNKSFTGVTPKWCYGKTLATKYVSAADKVEEHVGLKSSMTSGSDGAPWLVKYSSAKRLGYVNGVTSLFGDTDGNGRIDINTSAYFDGETAGVYNKAAAVWSGSIAK